MIEADVHHGYGGDVVKMLAATFSLLLMGAVVSNAGVVWDESINGELSHSAATPTILPFEVGGNVLNGSVGNVSGRARDYIRFDVPPGHLLISIYLREYTPDNTGFAAINAGVHSYFPSFDTDPFFMSGIHLFGSDVGSDLMDRFVDRAVTSDALGVSEIDPGTYCMVIQQTSVLITTYSMEFVLTGPVSSESSTWGAIKALYR